MASRSTPPTVVMSPEHRAPTKATVIFSFTCVGLTGLAVVAVLVLFCQYRVRRRAPVTAAGAAPGPGDGGRAGVDITKLPEFAYAQSARRRDGGGDAAAQCSVCLGTVQDGEMVRRLPLCKHLYHVECIDMWLASHTTCPVCRADVEPAVDDGQAAPSERPHEQLPV